MNFCSFLSFHAVCGPDFVNEENLSESLAIKECFLEGIKLLESLKSSSFLW